MLLRLLAIAAIRLKQCVPIYLLGKIVKSLAIGNCSVPISVVGNALKFVPLLIAKNLFL